MDRKIIFITGGVRSGKSAFAENYAKSLFKQLEKKHLIYIASGVAFDEEMEKRIERHQMDREHSEVKWETIEIINTLPNNLTFSNSHIILWDCITTWLSNILFKTEMLTETKRFLEINHHLAIFKRQLLTWRENGVIVLLVSNEVLDEPYGNYSETNLYRRILGELHQWIVNQCDEAYEMDYSLNRQWK
ncbi:bifunctional adenosylcobinamide kinase/adenosylcobinamide-phosphate guanylyltransferase [Ureibacillus composti]